MRLWKTTVALVLFCLIFLFIASSVKLARATNNDDDEGFQNMADIQRLIQQLQGASGQLGELKAYEDWIGWIYTNPQTSTLAFNDFKSRVFQPNCKFRDDWSTRLPPGKLRPNPAANAQLANTAYRTFLGCLAKGNAKCTALLDDVKQRFMEPDCNFLNPADPASYSQNVSEVFK
jgi:hypothetical protein